MAWRGVSANNNRFQPGKRDEKINRKLIQRWPTFEHEKNEEGKVVTCLGRVADVIEKAEVVIGAWEVNLMREIEW